MVDPELLESRYDRDTYNVIVLAFRTLADLGVWNLQVNANTLNLCEGFTDANPTALAEKILQVQQTNRNLLALHELGALTTKGQ
jgi:hypothetical protein